jgi:cobalt-zinc-cadmium efflux system protein
LGVGHSHTLHHGHAHDSGGAAVRALAIALVLNASYTACEAFAGLATDSLALLADAGHNLSDVIALAIALGASWLATRPPTSRRTFGFKRAEILAAFINALTLVVVALVIAVEALRRIGDPPDVPGGWLIIVAALGIVVNAAGAAVLMRGARDNLNLRASFIHLAGDALGSALVIGAGVVIVTTGFEQADTIASLLLAALILASAWGVLRDSTAILMEQTPPGIDPADVRAAILGVAGVRSFHDLHIWTISSGFDALSAHVLVGPGEDCHQRRRDLEAVLSGRFGITHTTLQVDHATAEVVQLRRSPGPRADATDPDRSVR